MSATLNGTVRGILMRLHHPVTDYVWPKSGLSAQSSFISTGPICASCRVRVTAEGTSARAKNRLASALPQILSEFEDFGLTGHRPCIA